MLPTIRPAAQGLDSVLGYFYCEVFMNALMEKMPGVFSWVGFLLVTYLCINGFLDLLVRGILPAVRDAQVFFFGL